MRMLIFVLALLMCSIAQAQQPYKDFLPNLPKTMPRPMETEKEFLARCRDEEAFFFTKRTGKFYSTALYEAAHADRSALASLFLSAPYQDGAAAQGFAATLFWLLHKTGDKAFSETLLKQPPKTRKVVIGLIDYAATYDYSSAFPMTFKAAKHEPQ